GTGDPGAPRGSGRHGGTAADLAPRHLAQPPRGASLDRRVSRPPRDTRARLAPSPTRSRSVALVRTRRGRHASHQVLLREFAADRVASAIGSIRASTLGNRAAIPGPENRARARSFRG